MLCDEDRLRRHSFEADAPPFDKRAGIDADAHPCHNIVSGEAELERATGSAILGDDSAFEKPTSVEAELIRALGSELHHDLSFPVCPPLPRKPFDSESEIAAVEVPELVWAPPPQKPFDSENEFIVDMPELDEELENSASTEYSTDATLDSERPPVRGSYSNLSTIYSVRQTSAEASVSSAHSLKIARNHGQRRLHRLRGPTLMIGPLCMLIGFLCGVQATEEQDFSRSLLNSLSSILLHVGAISVAMSLLPSDRRCVPLSMLLVGLPALLAFIVANSLLVGREFGMVSSNRCSDSSMPRPCWFTVMTASSRIVSIMASLVSFIVFVVAVKTSRSTEWKLRVLWNTVGAMCAVSVLVMIIRCIASFAVANYSEGISFTINAIVALTSCYFSFRYKTIRFIQSWLMSRGEAATVAAGIAELLGGQDPEHVLAIARKTFASVPAEVITADAMRLNYPDPALSAFAYRTTLGHADAFVSHSWHDDPDTKWQELRMWCAEFKQLHHREPRLWIDKYCIDQNNIEESLACLPIYLSGCRKLVILCGKTYLKRLWCLIEVFVFLEMGGKIENLEVRLLENKCGHRSNDAESDDDQKTSCRSTTSLAIELLKFDSLNARCANAEDTMRLQRVIDVIGSEKIDRLVNDVFVGKLGL